MKIQTQFRNNIHPHKFALWISMASIMMMFAALTSAYIVRQGQGNWLEFPLPNVFYLSTFIIVLSSVSLHFSKKAFLQGNESNYKILLVLTFVLGIGFLVTQYLGWSKMLSWGIDLKGNPSGSFLYVITGLHTVHIVGGLAALLVAIIHAFGLPYSVTEKRKNRFDLVIQYWHFVGFLWIYLLTFLLLSR